MVLHWLLFTSIIFLASISPGPNVLIVITNSMRVGWRKAFWTIAGNLVALFLIALSAALGVGAILVKSQVLFSLLKILGGMYLLYLGYRMWKSRDQILTLSNAASELRRPLQLFTDGFTVSLSNPKAVVFLVAIFPQFIDASIPLIPQFATMFMTIILMVMLIHGAYGIAADRLLSIVNSRKINLRFKQLSAAVFCWFGALLAGDGLSTIKR